MTDEQTANISVFTPHFFDGFNNVGPVSLLLDAKQSRPKAYVIQNINSFANATPMRGIRMLITSSHALGHSVCRK